jgi:outer membrane protein TolC
LFERGYQIDPDPVGQPTVAELAEARVRAARRYLEVTQAFFEQGTINIDRLLAASRCLMEAERDAAGTKAGEVAALRAHAERMKKIVERERAKFEVGSGSIPNVQEAEYHRREAEYWLALAQTGQDQEHQARGDRPVGNQPGAVGRGSTAPVPDRP